MLTAVANISDVAAASKARIVAGNLMALTKAYAHAQEKGADFNAVRTDDEKGPVEITDGYGTASTEIIVLEEIVKVSYAVKSYAVKIFIIAPALHITTEADSKGT